MTPRRRGLRVAIVMLASLVQYAHADSYQLSWHTLAGGGGSPRLGGPYSLGGTIGQSAPGALSGGGYVLLGGFWAAPAAGGPSICPGDLNCDNWVDFDDINPFILMLSNWEEWKRRYADCPEQNADVNGDGIYGGAQGFADINPFINLLASNGGHPVPCK